MTYHIKVAAFCLLIFFASLPQTNAQNDALGNCHVIWKSQSKSAAESMPCGGGDVGLNVWVEEGELLFYIAESGTFDENNALLKSGRVRVRLSPNPFSGTGFQQELVLRDGYVRVNGSNGSLQAQINIWVDVFNPVVHVDVTSNQPVKAVAAFESWRYQDRASTGKANNANAYKWAPQGEVKTWRDEIAFNGNSVLFYHRNKPELSVFDVVVKQQGMEEVKDQLFDPLRNLTSGGLMEGSNMSPAGTYSGVYTGTDFKGWKLQSNAAARSHTIAVYLCTEKTESAAGWKSRLQTVVQNSKLTEKTASGINRTWWQNYWKKSFIYIQPGKPNEASPEWQAGRNYQLFRYMLGCNTFGAYPTKFNGGLFTYDPSFTDSALSFTPDFRNWGGGTHTAQNQRLVYFPMIKSGDFEAMKPQFDFYLRILKNAELRSQVYWGHKGACFTEQMENFGLPNPAEWGWNRPPGFDKGVEYNPWLEYEWDTVLEFCLMMLEVERYTGKDIGQYIPFIESCLQFFDEHYQYLAERRGIELLDENGHLVLYPGSATETYKMAYNSTSTVAALKTVITRLLQLPGTYLNKQKRAGLDTLLQRIPPVSFGEYQGHKTLAPAKLWARVNNVESPQLYPVFPWGIYGIGKPDLDIALNTWNYDTNVVKFRSHVGWKQDNIFAARLGLTADAAQLTTLKLQNSDRRFPAFWGPGFDWTPDHNWGGSGMIGLQDMLLQADGEKIYLFPAWPKKWDVHFKLFAPYNTTVEGIIKNGRVELVRVLPAAREKDVVNMF